VPDDPTSDAASTVLLRDHERRQVAGDIHERQPVFSVTKMFIAVACLQLAERHSLDLDHNVRTWLPSAPAEITVRELLSHTAGLPDYPATDAYQAAVAAHPAKPWDLERILAVSLAQPMSARGPVRYCNVGYWMLGALLEQLTGTSIAEVLTVEVFGPAAMTATTYPEADAGLTADGYNTRWAGAAGAVWSTAADLDNFLAGLLNGTLLSPAGLAAMRQATPIEPHPPWRAPGYGLGLMTDDALHTLGHGGNGPGYKTAVFSHATADRTAVIITSASEPDPAHRAIRWLTR
jgi:D-alanyl-D-alanine carboxypeptidase